MARRGILLVAMAALLAGCGDDDAEPRPQRIAGTPDPAHAKAVERDPYLVTCGDIKRQPLHPLSEKLVIHAEFALAQVPQLRAVRAKETLNRTGRSVYYAMTELCKGKPASFEPGKPAVAAVRAGKYLAARNRPG